MEALRAQYQAGSATHRRLIHTPYAAFNIMDKEALRKQIADAQDQLAQALHAFEDAPAGTFDEEEDEDIIGDVADIWIMQNAERDGGLWDETFISLTNLPCVK